MCPMHLQILKLPRPTVWKKMRFQENTLVDFLPAGKGMTSWLWFVVSAVSLSLSHWYPGSGVVLDCIDS